MFKYVLFPFALLYRLITQVRNLLYNFSLLQTTKVNTLVISIGNLTVGGTGKTPHVEYVLKLLISLLPENQQIAMLSRGYGRKTKNIILANQIHNEKEISPLTIGDEPMQIWRRFGKQITVCVGGNRVKAAYQIKSHQPQNQVIVLDDAYQHRAIHRDINILLTDYYRPFYEDYLLPMGRLRESCNGAKRADVVIVSKCPLEIREEDKKRIEQCIRRYTHPQTPIFFTSFAYASPKPIFDHNDNRTTIFTDSPNIILLTAIANTKALIADIGKKYQIIKHFAFTDHYVYQKKDIEKLIDFYRQISPQVSYILTTEKDSVKLIGFADMLKDLPIYFLPIEVCFLGGEEEFKKEISQNTFFKTHNIC
jgi:tetraacyldisaccharide 4'-kinase